MIAAKAQRAPEPTAAIKSDETGDICKLRIWPNGNQSSARKI